MSRPQHAPSADPVDWPQALEAACTQPGVVRPFFQPIVDLTRGVVTGYEALARFAGPPQAGPDRWFAEAAAHGCADRLEAQVLRSSLAARDALPVNCFLTVNCTPATLPSAAVQAVFAAAGDLSGLVVEITEQVPVDDYEALRRAVAPLRAAGALLAIDDTGAGFASLRHVMRLRPEFVKIDRELVAGIHRDEAKVAVVEALGTFAARLDAWIIAEGVEEQEEIDRLAAIGVPLAQGYALGRPAAAMGASSPELAAAQAHAERRAAGGPLAELARRVPSFAAGAPRAEIADVFLRDAGVDHVVLLDAYARPQGLLSRDAFRAGRGAAAPLCVAAGAPYAQVAQRAMARDPEDRFAPVVLCDERGRLSGLIGIDWLVQALARSSSETPDPTRT